MNFFNSDKSKFVIVNGSEVHLYEVQQQELVADFIYDEPKPQILSESSAIPLSAASIVATSLMFCQFSDNVKFVSQHSHHKFVHLTTEKRYQYIKCAAPSLQEDQLIVALGQASGKVGLLNFNSATEKALEFSMLIFCSCFDQS